MRILILHAQYTMSCPALLDPHDPCSERKCTWDFAANKKESDVVAKRAAAVANPKEGVLKLFFSK